MTEITIIPDIAFCKKLFAKLKKLREEKRIFESPPKKEHDLGRITLIAKTVFTLINSQLKISTPEIHTEAAGGATPWGVENYISTVEEILAIFEEKEPSERDEI